PTVVGDGSAPRCSAALGTLPYAEVTSDRGCTALPAGSLSGKVALIERGICNFADKINNAAAAGAVAAIVYNKDISEGTDGGDTFIRMGVAGTTIPSVFMTRTAGLALRDFVHGHAGATVSLSPVITADVVSPFRP